MTIYVSHSSKINYQEDLYKPLRESELAKVHEFFFPHEKGLNLFPTKELLDRRGCDLFFAEVSFPSHGQGVELGWAYERGVRIIMASKPEAKLSVVLAELSTEHFTYNTGAELISKLADYLK
jgi:hypothetical protein